MTEELEPTERNLPQRITDAEKERIVVALRGHCADGRLTLDEFSDRVGEVFAATSRGEAQAALRDLPAMAAPLPETQRARVTKWMVAFMSGRTQRSRWRPAPEMTAFAMMGGCEVDLRHAEIMGSEITITAVAFMGGIDIVVPEGIEVQMHVFPFMGGADCKVKKGPRIPGAPVVRVRGLALMGGVTVRSKGERSLRGQNEAQQRQNQLQNRGQQGALPPGAQRALEAARVREERVAQHLERQARRLEEQAERHRQRAGRRGGGPSGAGLGRELKGLAYEMAEEAIRNMRTPGSVANRMPTAPDGTVTILFSDIEGYTMLTERLGDLAAQEVLKAHNAIVRSELAENDGYEVKSQGDGFMVAFPSARKALACAIAIQRSMEKWSLEHPTETVRVRMGLHTGEALLEDGDFTGRTVILASRIAAQADGGEILVSSVVKELTESIGQFDFDAGHEVVLKGLSQPYRVHSVLW